MTWTSPLATLPAYWRNSGWLDRALVILLSATPILIVIAALLIWLLPRQETPVKIAPQFAEAQTGSLRFPINLPEPAAGSSIKIPLTLPKIEKAEEKDPPDGGAQLKIKQEVAKAAAPAKPRAREPRRPSTKYIQLAGNLSLPQIADDGSTPFDFYKAPAQSDVGEKARIALIVTDIGLNTGRSDLALETLPATVTIAVSPYAQDPQRWINAALDEGRDALIMVPMEPNSFPSVDPGPDTLMRDAPEIQTLERFHTVLSKAQGYMGIINDTGSRFTANAIALAPVLDDLSGRGLMVVDARASAYSVLAVEAAKRKIPVAINTRYIDTSLTPEDIRRQLRDLERTAQTLGVAVGVLRDLPVSVRQVAQWQADLDTTEFVLSPVSAVANQQPVR